MKIITDDHIRQVLREKLESDFRFFAKYFFFHQKSQKFDFVEHHGIICDALMDIYFGRSQNLIINIPPRHGKTELVIIMFVAWCFVRNPNCEFIHVSFSEKLVMDNSDRIRQLLKSHEFTSLWPELTIRHNKDAKSSWSFGNSGSFVAVAAGATVTGFGAGRLDEFENGNYKFSGCLLIDDPMKPDDANSPALRDAVNRRWDETLKNRRNSQYTPTICIMQRLHPNDFTYTLESDSAMGWRKVVIPAILDEGKDSERAIWPRKFSLEKLKEIQASNRHNFATQYQQTPYPVGGSIIKGEWFKRYSVLPRLSYRKIFADTAQKTKEHNDYSVFECWGLGEDGGLYLVDMIRGKWEAPELKRKAIDFWKKHKAMDGQKGYGVLRRMDIEDKASGTGLIQEIQRDGKIPVGAIERNKDKYTRALDFVGHIEAGHVYLPMDAAYVSDFVSECEAFTADNSHAHDDQIDPLLDAIQDMLASGSNLNDWTNLI